MAFRDVEREPLPVALDLAPPRLRCIEGDGASDLEPPLAPIRTSLRETPRARQRHAVATIATFLIVAVGMLGSWLVISQAGRDDDSPAPIAARAVPPEVTLADHAPLGLSSVHVPDLAAAGLRLTEVSTQAGDPASLVLHYRDAGKGRVTLGVASAVAEPRSAGATISWRRGGTAYALAGTLPADRLRQLAQSLQDETGQE